MAARSQLIVSFVGLMGTGKSTVARVLAERVGWSYVDLDDAIEAAFGQSINDIFQQHGEGEFRAIEARVLTDTLATHDRIVLATGGGAACQPGAMARLRGAGPVVWLDVPPPLLVARAQSDARPLLAGRSAHEAESFLATQLTNRRPFYAAADHHVDASRALEEVVDEVARLVASLLTPTPQEDTDGADGSAR